MKNNEQLTSHLRSTFWAFLKHSRILFSSWYVIEVNNVTSAQLSLMIRCGPGFVPWPRITVYIISIEHYQFRSTRTYEVSRANEKQIRCNGKSACRHNIDPLCTHLKGVLLWLHFCSLNRLWITLLMNIKCNRPYIFYFLYFMVKIKPVFPSQYDDLRK